MKIGIIGSGNIVANAARLFVRAGHEVALSNSRGGDGLEELTAELGTKARATTIEEAAEVLARLLEEIGFAAVDTGFLHEGGRRQ
jgi:predicted dinucleotide-binding enzyme